MRKLCMALFALAIAGTSLYAQSAREMDLLLADPGVSYARAARYVLPAAGQLPAETSEDAAFKAALERGWLPKDAEPGSPIRLDESAYLVMKAFSLQGGLMYSLFPGPRYAYRELGYRGYIQGRRDPARPVSGDRLVFILGRALDAKGGGE